MFSLLAAATNDGSKAGDELAESDDDHQDETAAVVKSILNGLQEPTAVLDAAGRVKYINDEALWLYNTTEDEANGCQLSTFVDTEDETGLRSGSPGSW